MTHTSLSPDPSTGRPVEPRCKTKHRPDWIFRILVTALFAVAGWLLAMPWVPAIAQCTMQRFHLQTPTFAAWAIQQPIPPMYSFANTAEVRTRPPQAARHRSFDRTVSSESDGVISYRTVNHFPTRKFTFADARVHYLRDRSSKWFVLRSTYRGQSIESVYRADPTAEEGWNVTLVKKREPMEENGL